MLRRLQIWWWRKRSRCPWCKSKYPKCHGHVEMPFGLCGGPCFHPWHKVGIISEQNELLLIRETVLNMIQADNVESEKAARTKLVQILDRFFF